MAAAAAEEALFELDDVRKRYGSYQALRGVSFTVPRGTHGLLGPNGAGKSTLLQVLLGLLPFEGGARVLGLDCRSDALRLRDRVGFMPERENHLPGMSAVEYVAYAAELSGLPRGEAMGRAHAVLEFCGLGDKRYQRVDGYSTGQKQRVKLAQAIVHDPDLLLLDEPTSGLDPTGRDEMLALIRSLPERRGCAVVLSTHLLGDVEAVCDRAILLAEGQLRYVGTIAALRAQGGDAGLEVRVKEGAERLASALGARGATVEREGAYLVVRKSDADAIFALADSLGLQIRHLQPRRVSLESAFLDLVSPSSASPASEVSA